MSDLGITVPDLFINDAHLVLKDSEAVFSGGVVILSGTVGIVMDGAELWTGRVSPCSSDLDAGGLLEVYRKATVPGGLSPVITGENHNIYSLRALPVLCSVFKKGVDLSPLIGLGAGFTPSGDDFITGVLLYEDVFVSFGSESSFVDRTAVSGGIAGRLPAEEPFSILR